MQSQTHCTPGVFAAEELPADLAVGGLRNRTASAQVHANSAGSGVLQAVDVRTSGVSFY